MSKKNLPSLPFDKLPSAQPLADFGTEVMGYLTVAQQESTKRTEIRAQRDVALEKIRSQRDVIMKMMHYTYAERAAVINKSFEALDKSLETGNVELAVQSMNMMVDIVKSSPLKTLGEVHAALESGQFKL